MKDRSIMRRFTGHPPQDEHAGTDLQRLLATGHGFFYVTTGIWPVLSIKTFQLVTGRKRDLWLVRTAGLLIASIGSTLMLAGYRGHVSPEARLLAVTSALSLAGIDLVYFRRGQIGPIYLVDAAGEMALAAAWLLTAQRSGTP